MLMVLLRIKLEHLKRTWNILQLAGDAVYSQEQVSISSRVEARNTYSSRTSVLNPETRTPPDAAWYEQHVEFPSLNHVADWMVTRL